MIIIIINIYIYINVSFLYISAVFTSQYEENMENIHSNQRFQRTLLCCSILLSLSSTHTFAEEQQQVLDTIKMTAESISKPYESGNMDIPRTENDVQAYTMIERKEIEQSGATTVTELITKLLPMATSTNNANYFTSTSSQINLRGLGASQTLVLINGRRSAGTGNRGASEATDQPNLNNIPLAAIERIEILPTSAAAIYGSGAVGGVINVILRKDYVGTQVDLRYGDTTDNQQPVKAFNLVSGFALEGGRTHVMITAAKKEQDSLLTGERNWDSKARQNILKNNPNSIYGMTKGVANNPPAGNLTNIRSKDGSELMPNWGSSIAHIPQGWSGNVANLGQGYALGLGSGVGAFSADSAILKETTTESVGISLNRDFTDRLNLFLEANYDREEGQALNTTPHGYGVVTMSKSNPNNPFGKDILVNYPISLNSSNANRFDIFETTQKKIATGFTFDLTPRWILTGDYSWSQSDISIEYARKGSTNPKASAWNSDLNSIDFLEDYTTVPTDILNKYWSSPVSNTKQTLHDISLRATGPVAEWYAGDIQLATGVEHRRYNSEGYAEHASVDNPWIKPTERQSTASSVYGEFNIPLISPNLNLKFAKSFDIQLATRYERFDVQSDTPLYALDPETKYKSKFLGYNHSSTSKYDAITPTIGFKFAPNDQIMFRASYSEGFVTPSVSQISEATSSQVSNASLKDPVTGKTITTYESISSGNPDLTPESSKSINAGIVLTPEFIPDLRLSLDYYRIKKDNNISSINAQYILDNQSIYGSRIKRDNNNDVISIDTTPFNALDLKTSGIDTNLSYKFDSTLGELNLNLGYTYVKDYIQQSNLLDPAKNFTSIVGGSVSDAPLKHRANASIYLQANDQWGFGWSTQYYSSYNMITPTAILNQTGNDAKELKIKNQIYHDIYATAKLPIQYFSNKLDTAELGFGISNLFNDYTVDMSGTQGYLSKYSDVRGRQYYINLKFSF